MVREINGLGGPLNTPTSTERGAKKAAETPATTANPASPADNVQLSTEAKTLQSLADKVASLPEVNLERAEKIKTALANGDYQIDNLVLADKILNAEALLGK